jgi:hypothetical protein
MADTYIVVVRHNVVAAIEHSTEPPDRPIPKTPLEVATLLATNNRVNGCIDGRYYFDNSQGARIFAELCLEFTRALVDKRLAAVKAIPVGSAAYQADDERDRDGPAPRAG